MTEPMKKNQIWAPDCELRTQGRVGGACRVDVQDGELPACLATLHKQEGKLERLIEAVHLSRPENYLSIYQSGCNFSCRKCHSWYFSQKAVGKWYSVKKLLRICRDYEKEVTLIEPRSKATAWHAGETCRCCGHCVTTGGRSSVCPGMLNPEQITLSPQGYGPVRNIVAFTGGDLTCRPQFYVEFAHQVKAETKLWVLIKTNGWGLTPENLELLQQAGVDAFWLDIKAFNERVRQWLTGCTNKWIIELPERITKRGFVLEVLSLYIPGLVETDQLRRIAELLASAGEDVPFAILAFFPEYRMGEFRAPTTEEMIDAYTASRDAGLKNVRLGNIGVFAKSQAERNHVLRITGIYGQR